MTESSPPPKASPTTNPKANTWENLDQALSRLESAILTQKNNNPENNTPKIEQLQRQNTHLTTTLQQTLADLKTILNS